MTFSLRSLNFALALSILFAGLQNLTAEAKSEKGITSTRPAEKINDNRQIIKGDQLSFRIVEDEEPSKMLTVSDSGRIRVPYVGAIMAVGKTPRALALEIKHALERGLYKNATVVLSLEKRSGQSSGRVYLTGEIAKPGAIDLPRSEDLTVSRVILLAGGFSEFANKRKVRLIHKTGSGESTEIIDIIQVLEKGRVDLDKPVQPGDVIIVPARLISW